MESTTFVARILDFETPSDYIMLMNEFLEYVRRRKAILQKELKELEAAERVYLNSGVQLLGSQELLPLGSDPRPAKPTIIESVFAILSEVDPDGLTALEILERLNARWWGGSLKRTSLSPQLSRMRRNGEIVNEHSVWKIGHENAPPGEPNGAS